MKEVRGVGVRRGKKREDWGLTKTRFPLVVPMAHFWASAAVVHGRPHSGRRTVVFEKRWRARARKKTPQSVSKDARVVERCRRFYF